MKIRVRTAGRAVAPATVLLQRDDERGTTDGDGEQATPDVARDSCAADTQGPQAVPGASHQRLLLNR